MGGGRKKRELKRQLGEEQNWRCCYCGERLEYEMATIDHVIARCRGGNDDYANLVISCGPCNQDKGRTSWLANYQEDWV
jgi:uncharacterized protein (TIGR02646 family)